MSNRFRYVLLPAVLLIAALDASEVGAESVVLLNQLGVPGSLADNAASVQVVIVVSAKRLRRLKPWERALREEFGDLPVLRVADLPLGSTATYEQVAGKLAKRLPPDLSVLIDLEGRWAETHGLDTSVPNLLLFAAGGDLIARQAGMFSGHGFAEFADHVRAAIASRADHGVPGEP